MTSEKCADVLKQGGSASEAMLAAYWVAAPKPPRRRAHDRNHLTDAQTAALHEMLGRINPVLTYREIVEALPFGISEVAVHKHAKKLGLLRGRNGTASIKIVIDNPTYQAVAALAVTNNLDFAAQARALIERALDRELIESGLQITDGRAPAPAIGAAERLDFCVCVPTEQRT